MVKIGAYLPPSRLPPAQVILIPPGAEGQRVFDMRLGGRGGAARGGKAAGITERPSQEPTRPPEPEVIEAPPAEAPAALPPPQPADTPATPAPARPSRTVRIGPAMGE